MITTGSLGPRGLMVADALVVGALALFAVLRTPAGGAVWGLIGLLVLPLVVRRLLPTPVLVLVLAAGAAAIMVGVAGDAVVVAIALALYPVGLSEEPRSAVSALVAAVGTVAASGIATIAVPGLPLVAVPEGAESFVTTPATVLLYTTTVIVGSWVLARAVRARRGHAAQLADLRARQAVADERLRIARDIHDVVGHSLGLIAMKAAVANHLVHSHPEEGRAALDTIERVSRGALDDVRTVLDALRDPDDTTPSVAEIDRLVTNVRDAGVTVEVDRDDLTDVPAAVQASAYRIVQEALTNVLRHAGPTRCVLTLTAKPGILTVSVIDEGTRKVTPGRPGHGLLGMQERVALHGGTLDAGPEPGGGFGVRARLPYVSTVRDE